ncbi:nuclear transport factor 2 family protein [Mucilaginibacter sp. 21P]|uniref:nuclear transport factor 2 family protein n=1 Tax=Mucilaginibacter sp. 21P TaxID=2778902 RepID=UPI001C585FCE|nr:nuclear transport factor 2 family protein [Mucilaginibacter sp. 21P]QXV63769.1 nuclear transport factor 2 family protein [Mucilaginibacter sp. 21P]
MEYNTGTTSTKEVIKDFYNALASRNTKMIAGIFATNIDWLIPGDQALAPWLGYRSTPEEVKDFFDMLLDNIESKAFEIEHLITDGDFGVVTGKFVSTMLATGKDYSSPFSAHFRIEDGLIVYYRFLEDSYALVKALTPDQQ